MFDSELVQDGHGNEIAETSLVESTVANGGAMQQVRTGYTTAIAVQRPRELKAVQRRVLEEARLMGEAAYYGWAAGKDRIEGPSQALAYSAARCWGNCAVDQLPLEETKDAWVFTSVFVDVETGFTLTRKFRQSKRWTVHGKLDPERKDDVRFQIGQTKGDRNVILKALPKWLIDQAMDEAKAGVRNKVEKYVAEKGIAAAIDMVLSVLKKIGVKEDRVLAKFGVAKKTGLTVENIVVMRGDISAIESGQEYADALYPSSDGADIADQLKHAAKSETATQRDTATPEHKTDSDPGVWDEYCDQLQQCTTPDEVRAKQSQYADAFGSNYSQRAIDRAEMRLAEIAPRGQRSNKQQSFVDGGQSVTESGH